MHHAAMKTRTRAREHRLARQVADLTASLDKARRDNRELREELRAEQVAHRRLQNLVEDHFGRWAGGPH